MSFLDIPGLASDSFVKPGARILFISDYRYEADITHNRAFSEAEDTLLSQCLAGANSSLNECSVLHVISAGCTQITISKYWSIKGGFSSYGMDEVQNLRRAIESLDPLPFIIVPLGEISLQAISSIRGIGKYRGSILKPDKLSIDIKMLPTISPKIALRQYLYRYHIQADLIKALKQAEFRDIKVPKRELIIEPSFEVVMSYLDSCKEVPRISVDIETARNEVSCIAFSKDPLSCISIPFYDYWTLDEEMEIWLKIDDVLGDPKIGKIFQNGMFDMFFLLMRNKIITRGYIHDTMIQHNLNYPDFPKSLAFLTSIYTDEPYYKDDGKKWFKDIKAGSAGEVNQFYIYNAKDAATTYEILYKVEDELRKFGNLETYDISRRLFNPLLCMQAKGIKVNHEALAKCKEEAHATLKELQEKLNEMVGYSLNVNSPKACNKFFYVEKGYSPHTAKRKDSKTGERKTTITCDDKAIKKIIKQHGSEEARLVQQIRKIRKLISTYFELTLDADGRLRCSFDMARTNTGRLASSETCFGTGQNLQNLPKSFRVFLVVDEGKIGFEIDLSQAEWVLTAYACGDPNMIRTIEERQDVHVNTGHLMFRVPKDLIVKEDEFLGSDTDVDNIKKKRAEHIPDIFQYYPLNDMTVRQAGKKCLAEGTEVLTGRGWIAIEYLEPFDQIAQWESGIITFVQPSEYFEYEHEDILYELSAKHVHQLVTPEHRILIARDNERSGDKYQVINAEDLDTHLLHYHIPTSGKIKCPGKSAIAFNPDEIRLLVAIQADGCITKYGDVVFRFRKPRKTQQLRNILAKLDIKYTEKQDYFFIFKANPLIKKISYFLGPEKNFGSYLLNSSYESLLAFIEEVPNWDGFAPKKQYFSTNKNNAEWVQTISHITLRRATIKEIKPKGFGKKLLYWVTIGKATGTSLVSIRKDTVDYSGKVFCVTVPSSFFMIRSCGKISITGNSNHSFNYGLSPNGFALQYGTDLKNAKRCFNLYHDAYPNIRIWHQHVRYQLGKTRTLENLFGRKRRFLDRWNEDLFKAAYSYNPQSTIAQLLNMALIDIYEQQDELEYLRDVELLNQVHDSVWFQYPISKIEDLPKVLKFIQGSLQRPLHCHGREFFIRCDCKGGVNFKQLEKVDLDSPSLLEDLIALKDKLNILPTLSIIDLANADITDDDDDNSGDLGGDESEGV